MGRIFRTTELEQTEKAAARPKRSFERLERLAKQPENKPKPALSGDLSAYVAKAEKPKPPGRTAKQMRKEHERSYTNLVDQLYTECANLITDVKLDKTLDSMKKAEVLGKLAKTLPMLAAAEKNAAVKDTKGKDVSALSDDELRELARKVLGR